MQFVTFLPKKRSPHVSQIRPPPTSYAPKLRSMIYGWQRCNSIMLQSLKIRKVVSSPKFLDLLQIDHYSKCFNINTNLEISAWSAARTWGLRRVKSTWILKSNKYVELWRISKANRVILEFSMSFGRKLVVLLTKPSMFGKCVVHAWR